MSEQNVRDSPQTELDSEINAPFLLNEHGDPQIFFQVFTTNQRAKKVVSDSPGLVDFAIGLVNSVLNLPDGQAKIFRRVKITKVL